MQDTSSLQEEFLLPHVPCMEDSFSWTTCISWITCVRLQCPPSSIHNGIVTLQPPYAAVVTLVPTPCNCATEGEAKSALRSHRKMVSPKCVFSCISPMMWLAARLGRKHSSHLFPRQQLSLSHLNNYILRFLAASLLSPVFKWCRYKKLHLITTNPIALCFRFLILSRAGLLL